MKKDSVPLETAPEAKAKKRDYFELRIPRLSFHETNLNVFLVFVLIIFAFLLGMLTNKVLYLQTAIKGATANTGTVAAQGAVSPTVPPPPQVVDVDLGKLPIQGNKDAKVTVVEFSDFQCPFCKKYFDDTHQQLTDTYIKTGKIKFAYRHYPLNSIHPNAQIGAEASECANEQDAFWAYHDLLFQNQDTWSSQTADAVIDSLVDLAGQANLNTDQFRSCVTAHKYKKNVDDDTAAGAAVQVDGTPTFFVNGYRIVGAVPFSELQQQIDEALKK